MSDYLLNSRRAKRDALLADRAAGKNVSTIDIFLANTLVSQSEDRVNREELAAQNERSESQARMQEAIIASQLREHSLDEDDQRREKEDARRAKENLKFGSEISKHLDKVEKSSLDFLNKFYDFLLRILPAHLDWMNSNSNDIPAHRLLDLLYLDLSKILLHIIGRKNTPTAIDSVAWIHFHYYIVDRPATARTVDPFDRLEYIRFLWKESVELDDEDDDDLFYTEEDYDLISNSLERVKDCIKDLVFEFGLEDLPTSNTLLVCRKIDHFTGSKWTNEFKTILFLFSKSYCGLNDQGITPSEIDFVKKYKRHLESFI